jgi:RNase P subunit RPR2
MYLKKLIYIIKNPICLYRYFYYRTKRLRDVKEISILSKKSFNFCFNCDKMTELEQRIRLNNSGIVNLCYNCHPDKRFVIIEKNDKPKFLGYSGLYFVPIYEID